MTETVCCELTEAGAQGVERYTAGQRLLLPEATARYFERHGWARILDLDDPDPDPDPRKETHP